MANMAVHLLSRMFTLAEAWDLVAAGRNPCRGLRRYRTRPRDRFLTREEYRRLGRALRDAEAEGSIWPPAVAAIRLLTLTGCRRSEILSLCWDDVDRTAGNLRLKDAKAGPRMAPLDGACPSSAGRGPTAAGQPVGDHRTKSQGAGLTGLQHYWEPIRDAGGAGRRADP